MWSVKLFGPSDIRLTESAVPDISEDEILLKTRAAAICGSDLRMIANGYSGVDEAHPLTLGHEISGMICKVGSRVEGYRQGMRVAVAPNYGCGVCGQCVSGNTHLCSAYQAFGINSDGGFAEYVRLPARAIRQGNLVVLPEGMSWEEGAIIEPMSCVLNGQERLKIQVGDRVLVVGAGPIGVMHALLARAGGASAVYVCDSSAERLRQCEELAPGCIPLPGALDGEVAERTGGGGVDVCIVACSSAQMQAQALSLAAVNGRVLFFGGLPASAGDVPLYTNHIHYKQLSIHGSTRANLRQYRLVVDMVTAGTLPLSPLVTNRFSLSEWEKALDHAKNGRGMKTIFTFS